MGESSASADRSAMLRSLGRAIALGHGFALHLVGISTSAEGDAVVERVTEECEALGVRLRHIRIDPYEERSGLVSGAGLTELVFDELRRRSLDAVNAETTVVWLDLSRAPAPSLSMSESEGPDDGAFRLLFQRMNERRNEITRLTTAQIVLIAANRIVRAFAEEAPDFWSVRSVSIRLPAPDLRDIVSLDEYYDLTAETRSARSPYATGLAHTEREIGNLLSRIADAPEEPTHRAVLAKHLLNKGRALIEIGELQPAIATLTRAAELSTQLASLGHHSAMADLGTSLRELGAAFARAHDQKSALASATDSVRVFRTLERDAAGRYAHELAGSLSNLSVVLQMSHDYEGAETAIREALDIHHRMLASRTPEWESLLPELANSLSNLGGLLVAQGRVLDAIEAIRDAISCRRQLALRRPGAQRPELASLLHNMAIALVEAGDLQGAFEAARESLNWRCELAEEQPELGDDGLARGAALLRSMLQTAGEDPVRDIVLSRAEAILRARVDRSAEQR